MPSSLSRKEKRQFLGATKKIRTFRWIGGQTVGVCQLVRAPCLTTVHHVKADDGAERSFLRRKRKRVRGQRRGALRSRGDKPRSSSAPTAQIPTGDCARVVNHRGRKFIWSERVRSEVVKSASFRTFAEVTRAYRLDDDSDRTLALSDLSGDPHWEGWTCHLRALRSRARAMGIPDGANAFSRSALDFIATNTSQGGEVGFLDILAGLRDGKRPADIGSFHDEQMRLDEEELSPAEELPSSSMGRNPKPVTARNRKKTRGPRRRRELTSEDGNRLSSAEARMEVNKFRDLFANMRRDA